MKKKFLPMLLALAIVLGLLPLAVFAAGSTTATAADGTVIAVAPLVDNSGVLADDELYTAESYTVELTGEEITLSATDLAPHQNGSEIMGYWAGVSFTPAGNKSINGYKIGTGNDYASISATASLYIYFDYTENAAFEEVSANNVVYSTPEESVTIYYTDGTADTYKITSAVTPFELEKDEKDIGTAKEANAWLAENKKVDGDGNVSYDPFVAEIEEPTTDELGEQVYTANTTTEVLDVLAENEVPYVVKAGDASDEGESSSVAFDINALKHIIGKATGPVKVEMKSGKSGGPTYDKLVNSKPATLTATPKKSFSISVSVGDQKVTDWGEDSEIGLELYIGEAPAQGNIFKLFHVADNGTWDKGTECTAIESKPGYFHVNVKHLSDYVAAEVTEDVAPSDWTYNYTAATAGKPFATITFTGLTEGRVYVAQISKDTGSTAPAAAIPFIATASTMKLPVLGAAATGYGQATLIEFDSSITTIEGLFNVTYDADGNVSNVAADMTWEAPAAE